ncbi:monocarboxylate transporter 12-like [Amblyomma americanum]
MPTTAESATSTAARKDHGSDSLDRLWSVPVAMAAAAFLLYIPQSSFGLFLVLFMDKFGVTREEASWPQSTASTVAHLSGILAFLLQRFLNNYRIVLLSTVLTAAAVVAAAFAKNMLLMTVALGVMYGFGYGLFTISSTVYTLPYFNKYQGVATSLKFSSWGLAGVIAPSVVTRLVDSYALNGAFLILGGLVMQTIPAVMLVKNPPSIRVWKKRPNTYSVQRASTTSSSRVTTINGKISSRGTLPQSNHSERQKIEDNKKASFIHALGLFRMPAFYVLVIAAVAGDYVAIQFLSTIVDYGVDKGVALDKAKQLTAIASFGELAGRLVIPLLADVIPYCREPLYSISFFSLFGCMTAMPHVSSFPAVVALALVQGIAQGYAVCIKYILVAEYLGVERTSACFGAVGVVMIPLSLVTPMIIGLFRDSRGCYDDFYRMLGGASLAAALIFGVFALWSRVRRRTDRMNRDLVIVPPERF